MVRYYGRYSSRTRDSEHERPDMNGSGPEAESQARRAAKIAWAKMIRKVYEVDPLACPECGAQMREAWLGAGEVPARGIVTGGAIVVVALAINELATFRNQLALRRGF